MAAWLDSVQIKQHVYRKRALEPVVNQNGVLIQEPAPLLQLRQEVYELVGGQHVHHCNKEGFLQP